MFSVVYGVLLHPFPYADVERLCNLSVGDQQGEIFDERLRGPELEELRDVHQFEMIATWNRQNLAVTGGEIPEDVVAYYGIGVTFPALGMPSLLGRNLGPSDSPDGQQPQPVVMLHYRFWQRRFNGDHAIVGKTLELDHKTYTIIGVTRPNLGTGAPMSTFHRKSLIPKVAEWWSSCGQEQVLQPPTLECNLSWTDSLENTLDFTPRTTRLTYVHLPGKLRGTLAELCMFSLRQSLFCLLSVAPTFPYSFWSRRGKAA